MNKKTVVAKNISKILKKNKFLVNLVVFFLGIIFVMLGGSISAFSTSIKSIFLNIGCSIIASSGVILITLIMIEENDEVVDLYDKWGIENIFETRSEQNVATAEGFPNLKNRYAQIAFGLKSLRDAKGKKFEEKVKNGLKIRILTMDPNSPFLVEREKAEGKQAGEIKLTILQLAEWIEKLKKISPNPNNVQIKYYDSLPLNYYCRQENDLFIGPYLYGKESQQTITYQFNCIGDGFRYYTEYFEDLWNNTELAKDTFDRSKV